VLLYIINENSPHHASVLEWWEKAVNGDEPLGLAWIVIIGLLRISTLWGGFDFPTAKQSGLLEIPQTLMRRLEYCVCYAH